MFGGPNFVLNVCLLLSFLPEALGALCDNISGLWSNQLGSEVQIDQLPDGRLRGKYYTTDNSLARGGVSGHDLVGALPYNKPGSSFAFSVVWQNGSSTSVWTGQCQVCEEKETLEMSWLLRSYVESCIDKWRSTNIGRYVFHRTNWTGKRVSKERVTAKQNAFPNSKCNLQGVWYNEVGSEVILNQTEHGIITGEYRTAVEREKEAAGTSHSVVYGSGFFGRPNSTFSLIVVWRGGKSVTGWVGQCHVCGENKTAILEMNWLLRTKVEKCTDVWKSTMYGANSFTRHEQRSGPRKSSGTHTPNRDGEDGDTGSSRSIAPCLCLVFVLVVGTLL